MIKPATYVKQCSLVELIATGEQEPLYFVSHWWGESVFDFIQCITRHSIDRKLGMRAPYWVCAYANNQWKLDEEIAVNLEETSFRKAMALSRGTVTVLDQGGETYKRVWCCFEVRSTFSPIPMSI